MIQEALGDSRDTAELGSRIRALRLAARLSQKQLADFSTLSVRAIRDIENGRVKQPRKDTFQLLRKALDLSASEWDTLKELIPRGVPDTDRAAPAGPEPLGPPAANGPILGRDDELATLLKLFGVEHRRLITLTGIEGVGKTRLAQELARALYQREGASVLWVAMADEPRGWLRQESAAAAVSARIRELVHADHDGVRQVGELIGDRDTLLVLDGVRRPGELTGLVPLLHRECPRLRVLMTARSALGAAATSVFPLAPLPVPHADPHPREAHWERNASVQVFLTYVQQTRHAFRLNGSNVTAVGQICSALDGLPMALELAARWSLIYSPWQLAEQLAADPLMVTRLPEGWEWGEPGLFQSVREALKELTPRQRALLDVMARRRGYWTMGEAAESAGIDVSESAGEMYTLLMHGLLRRTDCADQTFFESLNIVRFLQNGQEVEAA
ncbi:helix-turn-helix domain-containing protein [Streptomyces sp. NPDC058773]|uniref:helix-turn-helix domain-containing protein n=1 Tax=Streptomyces sp. NPDC058773 TaxID=3346632 RepID=UPI0036A64479